MTYLDANVLLRFLTKQPPEQAAAARDLLKRGQAGELELIVLPLIVAEVIYVLMGVYDYSPERTKDELLRLLTSSALQLEHEAAVLTALTNLSKKTDFPDAYLAVRAVSERASVASFDKGFAKLEVDWIRP